MARPTKLCGMHAINAIRRHVQVPTVDVVYMDTIALHFAQLEEAILDPGTMGDLAVNNNGYYCAEVLLYILQSKMQLSATRWTPATTNIEQHTNILLINTSSHWVAAIRQTTGEWLLHGDGVISRMSNPSSFLTMLYATTIGSAAYMIQQARCPTNTIADSTLIDSMDSSAMATEAAYQAMTQSVETVLRGGVPELEIRVTNTSPSTTCLLSNSSGRVALHASSPISTPPPLFTPMLSMPALVSQFLPTQPALLSQPCHPALFANTIPVLPGNSTLSAPSVQIPLERSPQLGGHPHCEYHSRAAFGLSMSSTMTCTCHIQPAGIDVPTQTLQPESPSTLMLSQRHEDVGFGESALSRNARNARRRELYAAMFAMHGAESYMH